jgi:hypothetical protein
MTRKKPAIRARPIRGVLTSDAEYAEQLRQWHIEAMFTLLAADGFSSFDLKALSDHPETKANFWFETALHFASKCHSHLKVSPLRNVVWDQGKLHDLMADFWFEERRCPGSEREITERLTVTPEYATRWGGYTSDTYGRLVLPKPSGQTSSTTCAGAPVVKFESRYARIAEIAAEVRANSREIARINLRGRGLRENLMQPLAYTISDAAILHDDLIFRCPSTFRRCTAATRSAARQRPVKLLGDQSLDHPHPRKTGRKNRAPYRRTAQVQARRRSRAKPGRIRRAQSARPLIRVP